MREYSKNLFDTFRCEIAYISHKMPCVFLSFTIIKLPVRILLSGKEVHTLCSFSWSSKERNSSERFLPSIVLTSITETYYGRRCPTLKMVLSCLLHFCLPRPFPTSLPLTFFFIYIYISLRSEYFSYIVFYISLPSPPIFYRVRGKKENHCSEILIRRNGKRENGRRREGTRREREMEETLGGVDWRLIVKRVGKAWKLVRNS